MMIHGDAKYFALSSKGSKRNVKGLELKIYLTAEWLK